MKSKTNLPSNVTYPFVAKHAADVTGVLCGLDRLQLRGTLRAFYQPTVRLRYLFVCQVLLKGFKNHAIGATRRIIDPDKGMEKGIENDDVGAQGPRNGLTQFLREQEF